MKSIFLKVTSLFLICVLFVFTFTSCSTNENPKLVSCELIKTSNGVNGIFTILNNEKAQIYNLAITVNPYDKNEDLIESAGGSYAIYVDPDHEATITVELPSNTERAEAVSYAYIVNGEKKSGEFKENNVAVFPEKTTKDTKIDTREELAEILIEDIEHQFMLQHYEAHGYYDNEKKQVIIASYANKTYKECEYAYTYEAAEYDALAKSIQQMSLVCYQEFQNYNFDDVKVSVGFLSSDEKIMISATNGEIVDNFS